MAQITPEIAQTPKKKRVLTPKEIELAEALSQAMVMKATAEVTLRAARREIGRLTGEINKLDRRRITPVWMEARELARKAAVEQA